MKKEYTKPNMEIVSFNVKENITATEGTSQITNAASIQSSTTITTINY
ncbi:MAG: hypothetical protein LUC92_05780 [Clostridiales bacterium]|nr:hypothetical protein [Clostridiales bacterium]